MPNKYTQLPKTVKTFIKTYRKTQDEEIKKGIPRDEAFGTGLVVSYSQAITDNPQELLMAMEICAIEAGVDDLHAVKNQEFQLVLSSIESDIESQSDIARRERLAIATDKQIKRAQSIMECLQIFHAVDSRDIDSERARILDSIENARKQLDELLTSADIDDDTNFEPSVKDIIVAAAEQTEGFEPETLKETYISFPDASISFIGAPTSRGKTSIMTSIAIDALHDTKRNIIFMSLEETAEQILRRLVFALAYRTANNTERQMLMHGITYSGIAKPRKAWKAFAKMIYNPQDDNAQLQDAGTYNILKRALDTVTNWQITKRLAICDCEGRRSGKIFARIAKAAQGDIVFYDYIQRLPCGIQSLNTDMRFAVQGINDELLRIAKQSKAIVIAGAQFNRTGGRASEKQKEKWQEVGDDNLDDNLFAETAGIEHDAHIAIGIGGNANDNTRHFLKVLKNREGEKDTVYNLDFCGAFSYVKVTEKMTTKDKNIDKRNEEKRRGKQYRDTVEIKQATTVDTIDF